MHTRPSIGKQSKQKAGWSMHRKLWGAVDPEGNRWDQTIWHKQTILGLGRVTHGDMQKSCTLCSRRLLGLVYRFAGEQQRTSIYHQHNSVAAAQSPYHNHDTGRKLAAMPIAAYIHTSMKVGCLALFAAAHTLTWRQRQGISGCASWIWGKGDGMSSVRHSPARMWRVWSTHSMIGRDCFNCNPLRGLHSSLLDSLGAQWAVAPFALAMDSNLSSVRWCSCTACAADLVATSIYWPLKLQAWKEEWRSMSGW